MIDNRQQSRVSKTNYWFWCCRCFNSCACCFEHSELPNLSQHVCVSTVRGAVCWARTRGKHWQRVWELEKLPIVLQADIIEPKSKKVRQKGMQGRRICFCCSSGTLPTCSQGAHSICLPSVSMSRTSANVAPHLLLKQLSLAVAVSCSDHCGRSSGYGEAPITPSPCPPNIRGCIFPGEQEQIVPWYGRHCCRRCAAAPPGSWGLHGGRGWPQF